MDTPKTPVPALVIATYPPRVTPSFSRPGCPSDALASAPPRPSRRVVCEFLNSNAKAEGAAAAGTYGTAATVKMAAADEYLQALDRALPETAEGFMQYIKLQADAEDGCGNNSGGGRGFVVRQLVLVASRCLVSLPPSHPLLSWVPSPVPSSLPHSLCCLHRMPVERRQQR